MSAPCICLWSKLDVVRMTTMLSMLISKADGDFLFIYVTENNR